MLGGELGLEGLDEGAVAVELVAGARLLGREVPVKDGCASIVDWLVLRQWDDAAPHDGQLTITLVVADLRAAREFLGDQAEQHADELRVRDPDGRRLLLRQDC